MLEGAIIGAIIAVAYVIFKNYKKKQAEKKGGDASNTDAEKKGGDTSNTDAEKKD